MAANIWHGHILVSVAVQIADGDRVRIIPSVIGYLRGECAVAIAQQYGHVVIEKICRGQILVSVAVQVADGNRVRSSTCSISRLRGEHVIFLIA